MPRPKGSGKMGPVRALRLPRALDAWFEERLRERPTVSSSALLLEIIHGGLRLLPGYMGRHRASLIRLQDDSQARSIYVAALRETFGAAYVAHLESWLESELAELKL